MGTGVTVKLVNGIKYYLSPIDPILILKPVHSLNFFTANYWDGEEDKNLIEVVNKFVMNGEVVNIEPNPYFRAFNRIGVSPTIKIYTHPLFWLINKHPEQDAETWDPFIDPWTYIDKYRRRYTISEIIGWSIGTIIVIIISVLIITWIFGGF